MKVYHSLRFKLTLLMIVLLVLPLIITGYASYQKTYVLEKAVIEKEAMEKVSGKFKEIFLEHEALMDEFSRLPELQYQTYDFSNALKDKIPHMPIVNDPEKESFYHRFLTAFESRHEFLLNTYIATTDGEFYLSNIPSEEVDLRQYDPREMNWYQQAKKANGEVIWTTPYIDTGTGKSTITLAKTLTDTNGQVIGVVGFDFDMHKLSVLIREGIRNFTMIIAVIFIVMGTSVIFTFIFLLNRTITSLQNKMAQVAEGDLSIEFLRVKRSDELGELTKSFNQMVENLKGLVKQGIDTAKQVSAFAEQLTVNADETSKATVQIAYSIQEVSSGAEEQLEKIQQSNQMVNDISEKIYDISSRAEQVTQSSQDTSQKALLGNEIVGKAIEQMENISVSAEHSMDVMIELNNKSVEVEEIVTIINGIAEQTNLLALNAAIEAARAGEHGKGFAVVAAEVRKLAEQSGQATKRIDEIIKEIQENIRIAVETMNKGQSAVNRGSEIVGEAGTAFKEISVAVNEVSNRMLDMAQSMAQIHQSADFLVESMRTVSVISEKSTGYIQEVAAAAEEQTAAIEEVSAATSQLATMAVELQQATSQFRI